MIQNYPQLLLHTWLFQLITDNLQICRGWMNQLMVNGLDNYHQLLLLFCLLHVTLTWLLFLESRRVLYKYNGSMARKELSHMQSPIEKARCWAQTSLAPTLLPSHEGADCRLPTAEHQVHLSAGTTTKAIIIHSPTSHCFLSFLSQNSESLQTFRPKLKLRNTWEAVLASF